MARVRQPRRHWSPTPALCVSVRPLPSGGGYGHPCAPAIYRLWQAADGAEQWRVEEAAPLGSFFGKNGKRRAIGVFSEDKAKRLADDLAAKRGLPHLSAVRAWTAPTPAHRAHLPAYKTKAAKRPGYWTCVGDVCGECPTRHKTRAAAKVCCERHDSRVKRGHGPNAYSDRCPEFVDRS